MPLESCGRCGRWPRQEKCDPIPGSQTTLGRCWSHKIPATSPSEAMSGSHPRHAIAQNEVFMTLSWCWGTHWLRWRKAKKNSKTCEGKTFSCNRGCKYIVEQEQISTWRIVVRRMFWQVHCVISGFRSQDTCDECEGYNATWLRYVIFYAECRVKGTLDDRWLTLKSIFLGLHLCDSMHS